MKFLFCFSYVLVCLTLEAQEALPEVAQWETHEITLTSTQTYKNAYTDVSVWAQFTNQHGDTIVRPSFWDGENHWKVRFSPTDYNSIWHWKSFASITEDSGLHLQSGSLKSIKNTATNKLLSNGPLKMSSGHRSVVHHSGKPFLMVADTPWAIPFRATTAQVAVYAKDRQNKGFNTALMMTVQPDKNAKGPDERNKDQGFKRAFQDLSDGHLNKINTSYFQYYDNIIATLLAHEIVPVFQPVFHGYGWKGLQTAGPSLVPEEYVRYCKYLLARYGSQPAIWLLGADHNGKDPGILESGEMLQAWDSYQQPTGIHYNPCDDYLATWAKEDGGHCFHNNTSYHDAVWLDFQWAQTGHDSEHLYHKVTRLYDTLPTKAVANGEPTYEGMNEGASALGWWQGEEAWMQWMSGGTMGVAYGAATLWQWKISATETGWPAWTDNNTSWRQALDMEGSTYVGYIGKIIGASNTTDIEKRWDLAMGKPMLAKEGELYIAYLNQGGKINIPTLPTNLSYRWVNPKTGKGIKNVNVTSTRFTAPDTNPWVLIVE